MELKKELTNLLVDGLEELIKIGSNSAFWGSTRANSDAVLVLYSCLPEFDFFKLRSRSIDRIAKEANESEEFVNWNEEIWDTAIAIMALSTSYDSHKIKIHKALNWIKSKYITSSHSWNEEVWETLLALNAITYSRYRANQSNEDYKYFEGSYNWINSLYNTPHKGLLINWSNTALNLLFAIRASRFELDNTNKEIIQRQIQSSCEQILTFNLSSERLILWTSETWSNGLVLWAISEAKQGVFDESKLRYLIDWFKGRLLLKETPVEDKAFACIGIYKYLEYIEMLECGEGVSQFKVKDELQFKISRLINTRVKDFVPNPPFLDRSYHVNYYTINLNKRVVSISLILIVTFGLTYLTVLASKKNDDISKWLSIIPILFGIFATVLQLANIQIFPSKAKDNKG